MLSGQVSNNAVMLKAAEIAQATSGLTVINLLELPRGSESQQVMLQVRFAEVNRRALQSVGASLFASRSRFQARTTTQQFAAPDFEDDGTMVFSDLLNLFFLDRQEGVGAVIKALKTEGFFQSLAEPNLIAYNGQEASFLAGGEFPVPIVQTGGGSRSSSKSLAFGWRSRRPLPAM